MKIFRSLLPTRVVYEEEYGGYSVEVWFILWWYVERSFTYFQKDACELLNRYRNGESFVKKYKKYTVNCQ